MNHNWLQDVSLIDLTHTLSPEIPTWSGTCGFHQEIKLDYGDREGKVGFRVQQVKIHAGVGTHVDAPAHCIPGGDSIAALPLAQFLSPCIKIDISHKADESYQLSLDDVKEFEKIFGLIPEYAFILVQTGWDKYWTTPEKYINSYHFPSISEDAIKYLMTRKIHGIGTDTISPDRPDSGFPVHRLVLGAGKYIVENMANVAQMPAQGAYIIVLPIKGKESTEAPARVVGLVQKHKVYP